MLNPSVEISLAPRCSALRRLLWSPREPSPPLLPLASTPTVSPSTSPTPTSSPPLAAAPRPTSSSPHTAWLTTGRLTRHPCRVGRGFGLVFLSAIPTRMLYLGMLERVKSDLNKALPDSTDATSRASVTNFVAGGVASMCSQLLVVPVDVISQRLMVKVGGAAVSRLVPATRAREGSC